MNLLNRINQLLNLSSREWPRVLVAWGMVFLSRMGFIVGGSILTALFLGKVGIELLPLLFLGNALLMMLGTLIYQKLIHRVKEEVLITFTVLMAAASLVSSIFFIHTNPTLFFVFYLIAQSIILSQLNILISLFNEELFTPLESQRTFPIIESAETVGGIMGGLLLTLFADAIPSYKFILIWVILLIFILPIVLRYNARTMEIPKLKIAGETHRTSKVHYNEIKKYPFLKGMMMVVLLFWAIMNVLEFQYTKAIQEDVYSTQEETLVEGHPTGHEIALASEDPVQEEQQDYEQAITQKMGTLHLIFNLAALFMQLIFASRIISALGITSSMLLHPLVTLLNLIAMTLHFNFFTASLSRGSYELTGILFKNAYDSSYYAVPHELRRDTKEFMQGIMKPFGAILGTVGLLFIAFKLKGLEQTMALNAMLLVMSALMAFILNRMNRSYTLMNEQNLSHKSDLPTRLNAVEILGQKGHESNTASLQKILQRSSEPEVLKERILNTLGLLEDPEAIASLLEIIKNPNDDLRLGAIQALAHYHKLKKHMLEQSFTRYRVIESLKAALKKEHQENILEPLVLLYYDLEPQGLIEFLMGELHKDENVRPHFIRMLHLFKDPNLKYYLKDRLEDKDPAIKAAALVALWQFKALRAELKHHLMKMLESRKLEVLALGIETAGRVKETSLRSTLKSYIHHESEKIRQAALLSLAQMEDESVIPELILHFEDSLRSLQGVSKRFQRILEQALDLHVIEKISSILSEYKHLSLDEMSHETLATLKHLYSKVKAYHEAHKIEKILDSRS